MNIVEEFLKEQIEMWLDNYSQELDLEDEDIKYTQEDLDNLNVNNIVHNIKHDEDFWEVVDNTVRFYIDRELGEDNE